MSNTEAVTRLVGLLAEAHESSYSGVEFQATAHIAGSARDTDKT